MHFFLDHMFDCNRKAWRKSPKKRRDALKTAILTNKSKIFIKAKLTVSKSCLLGLLGFMIFCILRDVHIEISKYLSIWVFKLPFFWFLLTCLWCYYILWGLFETMNEFWITFWLQAVCIVSRNLLHYCPMCVTLLQQEWWLVGKMGTSEFY